MKQLVILLLALKLSAQDPRALIEDASAKMREAGTLAQQSKFPEANRLVSEAHAELDRAVEAEPDNVEFRARRGIAYSFSYLDSEKARAIADLKFAVAAAGFGQLAVALRRQASQRLAALTAHLDRFPAVPGQISPVIVAASFTLPPGATGSVPDWVESTIHSLKGMPGLLGTHAVASVDHPGMFILFTWWKDKKAVNDFFYGNLHQAWMRQRGLTMAGGRGAVEPDQIPTQTGVEVFGEFPGGTQIGGGFVPKEVFSAVNGAK